MKYPYFLSFIEEGLIGVTDWIFGRVEVYDNEGSSEYAIDELRFGFRSEPKKEKQFREFRDGWDFRNVTKTELVDLKKMLREKFLKLRK